MMTDRLTSDEIHTARLMRREGRTIEYIARHPGRSRGLIGEVCQGYVRVVHHDAQAVHIPAPALAARDARLALSPRDLTAAIAGDPLPGMSALERGQEKWEPVFRPAARPENLDRRKPKNGRVI